MSQRSIATLRYQSLGVVLATVLSLLCFVPSTQGQYALGDLGATASGNWNQVAIWSVWNGGAWVPAGTVPTGTSTAYVLSGNTVVLPPPGPYQVSNLIVEAGAKLWTANNAVNIYLNILGSTVHCDGQIGDGPVFDAISFNIDGANVVISGSGQFDASRIRKSSNINVTTNLSIAMDVNLRFNTGSTTQIYNNFSGSSIFNVTVEAGATVNLTGTSGEGNIAMDGIDGLANTQRGGTYTVNGTMLISGRLYLTTNNTNATYRCRFIINNGGIVRTNELIASASGAAGHELRVNDGGTLEILGAAPTWIAWSTLNNTYLFANESLTIYNGNNAQSIRNVTGGYGNLTIAGNGTKSLTGATLVKRNLSITDATGTPELDVTGSNFQITVGGDWTNYDESGFNERNGFVVFNQNLLQTVNTAGGEQFHRWRLAKILGSTVQLASDVRVADLCQLNTAILDLNGHELRLANGATTALTSTGGFSTLRHIRSEWTDNSSRVRWDIGTVTGAHLIPFGTPGDYIPFIFDLVAGDAGSVTVATYGTPPNNLPWPVSPTLVNNLSSSIGLMPDNRDATVDRFWQVDASGSPTTDLTFSYAASELPLPPYDQPLSLHAQRYEAATNAWMPPIEGQGLSAYSATVPGVTEFGPWTISAMLSPLPVELLLFDAVPVGDVVELHWATATERDNAFFTVLRSSDGTAFTEVLRAPGAGTSVMRTDYHATDDAPLEGLSYYQLRQTDHDGAIAESEIIAVYFASPDAKPVVFPNPTTGQVSIHGLKDDVLMIRVLDMSGRVVLTLAGPELPGMPVIDLAGLAAGRYVLRAETVGGGHTIPLVKQ